MKRKLQAQRKFAQGAYIPPVVERRADATPVKEVEDKRLAKNIIINNVSAKNLLDVVSMHNLHQHGQPIVLVERMVGAPLNGVDKPKTKELTPEPPKPLVNGHVEPKQPKENQGTSKINRDTMLLRSRSSKRRIIKKEEIKTLCPKKRAKPPPRDTVPKKMCTRNKSPGFSDDDDMPLKKITIHTNRTNTMLIKTPRKDDMPLKPSLQLEDKNSNISVKKNKLKKNTEDNNQTDSNKKVTKELEKDNVPIAKIINTNKSNNKDIKELEKDDIPLNKINNDQESEKDDIPLKITRTNKTTSKLTNELKGDKLPLNKINHVKYGNKLCDKNGKVAKEFNQINITKTVEKDDIPLSKIAPINKNNSKVKKLENVRERVGKDDLNKFCTLRSAATRSFAEDPSAVMKLTEQSVQKKTLNMDLDALPRANNSVTTEASEAIAVPSESYYGRNRIEKWIVDSSAAPRDPDVRQASAVPTLPMTSEPHHFKVPQLLSKRAKVKASETQPAAETDPETELNLVQPNNDKKPSMCLYSSINARTANKNVIDSYCQDCITCRKPSTSDLMPAKTPVSLSHEPTDVYTFDEAEPPKDQILGYNPKRLITKDTKNMYLDLPQNSAHIVKLVEVKMPNQTKPIMRARLVPKCLVTKCDTHGKETVTHKNGDERLSAFAMSSSTSNSSSINNNADGSNKGSDTIPLSSYVKEEEKETNVTLNEGQKDVKPVITVEAPTFYPTEDEFENPIGYLEKITSIASKYGLCKIVPPASFKPECHLDDTVRFTATNQYIGKMFSRWGPASRELCAIKTHLATQKVVMTKAPLIDSVEVNLPKLYHIVQRMGGLKKVIEKEMWSKVAEELNYQQGRPVEKKLDKVYVKYLLPYDTLTNRERQNILSKVEHEWLGRYKRMLKRARSPLHKQRQQLGERSAGSDSDSDDDPPPDEADDCVLRGRPMSMLTFEKVARSVMQMLFPNASPDGPSYEQVEEAYWRLVVSGSDHVCVNTAALDTSERGLGFTKNKLEPGAKHPWNLKILNNSSSSVLRSLGAVLSVTVPTLHLGMVFSTSCWHRDPHALPWLEYHHQGSPKIWYGIADEQSDRFRSAVEALCPAYCQNKAIWLPSDITMIPPDRLNERNVPLSKIIQKPGEFVVIFPKAYSCSICTGYTISESVYYAPHSWLHTVQSDFQMVRHSFEPTMFSLEQLLIAMVSDSRVPSSALRMVKPTLEAIVYAELRYRRELKSKGITVNEMKYPPKKKATAWNVRELDECDICRTTLYLSKVKGLVDKSAAHCPKHALKVLNRARDATDATLDCFYSDDALQIVLAKLRGALTSRTVKSTNQVQTVH